MARGPRPSDLQARTKSTADARESRRTVSPRALGRARGAILGEAGAAGRRKARVHNVVKGRVRGGGSGERSA